MHPALVIGGKTTGWYYAMDMWMNLEILSPGMQDAEESDLGSEMFGIGGDLEQSRGAGVEQKVVDDLFVVQSQPRQFVRDREHDMHVVHGQQFFIAIGEPPIAGVGLTLGAMSRPAGIK